MKKIVIILTVFLFTIPAISQTGIGWVPYRSKMNVRDSTYFYKDARFNGTVRVADGNFRLGAVTITANGTEINILDGLLSNTTELNYLVGVTSNVQTQLNSKAPVANPNFTTAVRLSGDTLISKTRLFQIIAQHWNDSINTRLASARNLNDLSPMWGDTLTRIATKKDIQNLAGGGSGGGGVKQYMIFKIGTTTGAPASGDTAWTQSSFAGKFLEIYRDGVYQEYHTTATNTQPGFRLNNTTGQITVNPPFVTGEQVRIDVSDATGWSPLAISGGGSTPSSLLTGLISFWQLDETSGISASDQMGLYPGTAAGGVTVNQVGKFGRAFQFNGTGYVTMSSVAGLRVQTHTISFYVKTTQTGSWAGLVTNFLARTITSYGYAVSMESNGTVEYLLVFSDGSYAKVESTATINDGNWHNIIAHYNGSTLSLFIDNVSQGTASKTGTIGYHGLNAFHLGDRNESDLPFTGTLDAVGIWNRVITSDERATLQTSTYPF